MKKTKTLKTIGIDLTPLLPGGANGGAKIFIIELIRQLAILAPDIHFTLLTSSHAHDELQFLDTPNMHRKLTHPQLSSRLISFLRKQYHFSLKPGSYLPGFMKPCLKRILALRSMLPNIRPPDTLSIDLLFCPFSSPAFHQPSRPTVCTLYDLQYKRYPQFFTPEERLQRDRTFQQALQKASMLIAISDYTKSSIMQHGQIDETRVKTIHLRMAERFQRTTLRTPSLGTKQYLIYPANFWKHKNHEMLIAAFSIAIHQGLPDHIDLVCTGVGEQCAWLMRAVDNMGLKNRVLFPGFLAESEMVVLLKNALGMVFPSLYEGFGIPVVEAMANQIPVACSRVTALPEIVEKAAILFDPRNPLDIAHAILQLATDDTMRHQLIESGLKRAENFADSQQMGNAYLQVFQDAFTAFHPS